MGGHDHEENVILGTITKNFSFREFRCPCRYPCEVSDGQAIDLGLVHKLQEIRDRYGAPLVVSSGCRCVAHNGFVGGALASQHLAAMGCRAADILVESSIDRAVLVRLALEVDLTVGVSKKFIHLDNRSGQLLFLY